MLRLASFGVFLAFLLQAQAQIPGTGIPATGIPATGIPASVNSPTADGRQHGIPASVVSPQGPRFGVNHPQHPVFSNARKPLRPFGANRRKHVLVPVPLFYPAYIYGSEQASVADPATGDSEANQTEDDSSVAADEDAVRRAYLRGMRDGMSEKSQSRYGTHYTDSRETASANTASSAKTTPPAATPQDKDDSPSAVFIFKDGHQLETRNFAIMGQTLYDFTSSGLNKVQLSDLDTTATQKANDDRGITVKLP